MKNILAVIKKEFFRFFKDRRLMLTTLILPGLMIFVVYSIMGDALLNKFGGDSEYTPIVYVNEIPESINNLFNASELKLEKKSYNESEIEAIKEKITKKEADLLIIFPDNFDEVVKNYDVKDGLPAPNIEIYYCSVNTESSKAYSIIATLLDGYEKSLSNKFNINFGDNYDLSTSKEATGTIFSMMLPFLILTFLFSACISVAPEAIAGEKERGTIATLLVTPIKRSELAIGKIISLSVIAILSALSSFVGTIASLPKLMGASRDEGEIISANIYIFTDYMFVLLIILTTVLVVISLMAILSAIAKSVKEASTIISPLMIITMLVGITSMFGDVSSNRVLYLIPIFNSVQAMGGIFSFNADVVAILITLISNVCYSVILVYILTRVFNNEKIMFSK